MLKKVSFSTNTERSYKAPTTETEKQLVKMWKQVLAVERIGIEDNFFELGGNSMKIVKLLRLLDEQFPQTVDIGNLFDKATVSQLASLIDEKQVGSDEENNEEEFRIIEF